MSAVRMEKSRLWEPGKKTLKRGGTHKKRNDPKVLKTGFLGSNTRGVRRLKKRRCQTNYKEKCDTLGGGVS